MELSKPRTCMSWEFSLKLTIFTYDCLMLKIKTLLEKCIQKSSNEITKVK